MVNDIKRPNHAEILKSLKSDPKILSLIYNNDCQIEWNKANIKNAVDENTDIDLNINDDILMFKLKDFFNVDLQDNELKVN